MNQFSRVEKLDRISTEEVLSACKGLLAELIGSFHHCSNAEWIMSNKLVVELGQVKSRKGEYVFPRVLTHRELFGMPISISSKMDYATIGLRAPLHS